MISMCACGGVNCPHCNPNLWTQPQQNTLVIMPSFQQREEELKDRIAELEEEKALTWGAIDAGAERYKARIKELEKCGEHRQDIIEILEERVEKLEAENQRLSDTVQTPSSNG